MYSLILFLVKYANYNFNIILANTPPNLLSYLHTQLSIITRPQIEGFLNKGIDVLLFTDAVDNFWVNTNSKYKDYEIKSVTKSNIDLENSAYEQANSEETKNKKEKKTMTNIVNYLSILSKC